MAAGGSAADGVALPSGWADALAASCAGVPSSAEFLEWVCHAITATINRMAAMAAAIETMKSRGGGFLISVTAMVPGSCDPATSFSVVTSGDGAGWNDWAAGASGSESVLCSTVTVLVVLVYTAQWAIVLAAATAVPDGLASSASVLAAGAAFAKAETLSEEVASVFVAMALAAILAGEIF